MGTAYCIDHTLATRYVLLPYIDAHCTHALTTCHGYLVFFYSVNRLHFVGVTGSYEGDEEVAVLVRETESMHKFKLF